ncbi:HigA family addiction module antitoxin [Aerophototrophica crusticola]
MSAWKFAGHIGVPPTAISGLLKGKRRVDGAMALRLGRVFGTSSEYWERLQANYERKVALAELGPKLDAITPLVDSPAA